MKTTGPNKVIIKVDSQEQQEVAKPSRSTLKVLQEVSNKENITARTRMIKDIKGSHDSNQDKPKKLVHKAVQTGEAIITTQDLTSDEPNADYWRLLAEKRGESLNDSLQENERLKDVIESLESENKICKGMLEESRHLVGVLQEMLGDEEDTGTDIIEEP